MAAILQIFLKYIFSKKVQEMAWGRTSASTRKDKINRNVGVCVCVCTCVNIQYEQTTTLADHQSSVISCGITWGQRHGKFILDSRSKTKDHLPGTKELS